MPPAPSRIAPTPEGPPTRPPGLVNQPPVHTEVTLARSQLSTLEPIKLGLSKKWVLPPRPKPGRKPNREKSIKLKGPQSEDARIKALKPAILSQDRRPSFAARPTTNSVSPPKDDCGACSLNGESCVCRDLKEASQPLVDPLFTGMEPIFPDMKSEQYETEITRQIDQFKPIPAVPLKRDSTSKTMLAKPKKFRRLDDVMQISVISEPSSDFKVDLSPGESCGFCKDNTPCLCAGEGLGDAGQSFNNHEQLMKPKSSTKPERKCGKPSSDSTGSEIHKVGDEPADYGCPSCQQEPMSMLFCLSLTSASPLSAGAVSISCSAAFKILEKHPRFMHCDLGALVQKLESSNRMVGVQSITKALQYLNSV